MTIHPDEGALQRQLDGELGRAEDAAVRAHLTACSACAARHEAFRDLRSSLGTLPDSIQPPEDLWAGIAARITAERPGEIVDLPTRRRRRGLVLPAWFAAAAAALVLGIALGRLAPGGDRPLAEVRPGVPIAATVPAILASHEDPAYVAAVADLQLMLAAMRDHLQPETIRVVEENLAIIDAAIEDARAALAADPFNDHLHRHFATTMGAKLQLLRTVTGSVTPI